MTHQIEEQKKIDSTMHNRRNNLKGINVFGRCVTKCSSCTTRRREFYFPWQNISDSYNMENRLYV